ncbi:MAG: lipase family protein [Egibacteraceae bacterium]
MDKTLALLLAQLSWFVYTPDQEKLVELGGPQMKMFADSGPIPSSFASVFRYPDKTVAVFKGTVLINPFITSVKDWITNFKALLVPWSGPGLVHHGFLSDVRSILDFVVEDLNSGFAPPLYVTGHSQGAGVAAVATKALELAGIDVTATYTIAAPLPGDDKFADSVKTPVYRLEFGDDIVPHVPLGGLPLPVEMALKASPQLGDLFGSMATKLGYVAVGDLTYGAPGQPLRINISRKEERELRLTRARHMATAGPNVFKHHLVDPHYLSMLR